MKKLNREQKYDAVNSSESLLGLSNLIKEFADKDGMIQGRTRKFEAEKMAHACMAMGTIRPNFLTREFGIRQQAMYLNYYGG